jgi:amidohydrolase
MNIVPEILACQGELMRWRRHLHSCPELGFEELATASFVAEHLEGWGIEVHRQFGGTGVVGVLSGRPGIRTVGLRADMDALPIQEVNTFGHKSRHLGKMHACGHDGHTVMLLGAAQYLAQTRDFDGTIHLIFQPAEETAKGAKAMLDAGLFHRFPCDAVFAVHNRPSVALGTALVNPGPVMAGAAKFTLSIEGVGGHAARPHLAVDTIVTAAQLIQHLQLIVSRRIDPLQSVVLTIASITAGDAFNVIPPTAVMTGTVRCFSSTVMAEVEREMRRIAAGIAAASGASITVDFDFLVPPTVNHPAEAATVREVLAELLGPEQVLTDAAPSPGSEDFAYMLDARPGAFVILGMREDRDTPMIHHPAYDFNDKLLPIGASFFVNVALRRLAVP